MKRIDTYRKILGVQKNTTLKELKTIYRDFMKEFHPDKFQDDEERLVAEAKSKEIIDAYHFLVSISPETHLQYAEQYTETITNAGIADFNYKKETLQITFQDGKTYEYFEVPKAIYTKLVNADSAGRFARRHICTSFSYRDASKMVNTAQ